MMRSRSLSILTLGLVLAASSLFATGEKIPWQTISSGGGVGLSSTNYLLNATVGQTAVGWSTSTNYKLHSGFQQVFSLTGGGCCVARVGDANSSGEDEPTIGDVTVMIDAKFITGTCDGVLNCLPEADINQSATGEPTCEDVSIGDITYLIDYLFITGPSLGLPDCS
ncbi:MAG: hypothetical protein AB1772_06675 [Candidatus Zixiibacteriota bacterium]